MKRFSAAIVLVFLVWDVFPQTIDPSSINIVRDKWGVPHIYANTDAEVAYGLAWAHSEDDFETIQKTILASKAMLGQYMGRDGATVDYVVHLLGIRDLVEKKYDSDLSDQFKAVLQGYCDGLNAFARSHPKELLEKKAFPVTPKDVIAYSVLQLALGCGVDAELKKIYHEKTPLAEWQPQGSNAFAFNSNKTEDGSVFLAINTHHPLEGQVAWYEAHLVSNEGWNILGGLFPGSPVIFTGVNQNLAWTHTVNHPDKIDVYQLKMNPENELQYNVDGLWYTLEESVVKLKVKVPGVNLHVRKKAYNSIYGPTVITDRGVFSIRTAGLMDIRGLEQWYRMNKSRNFHEFRTAVNMEAHPGYNIVYADRFDTIFYISNAKMPHRDPAYNWRKTLPGNTAKTLWTTFHPNSRLPQIVNPPSGYLFNANHSPFLATSEDDNLEECNFDPTMGYETHHNNRSLRVNELLVESGEKVSYAEFKKIKYDLQLPSQLAFPVNIDSLFLVNPKQYPQLSNIISLLQKWDRKAAIDSKGATVFAVIFYRIAAKYQADENLRYLSHAECISAYAYAKEYLIRHFGTVNVSLGTYQKLQRGDKQLPLPGLPDVLAAMYSTPIENGRVKGAIGECYISLIRFTPSGPEIETVNAFGASNRRRSVHYDDQMKLFQSQQTKKMSLDPDEVYRDAKTVYHPEVLTRLVPTARLTRNRR